MRVSKDDRGKHLKIGECLHARNRNTQKVAMIIYKEQIPTTTTWSMEWEYMKDILCGRDWQARGRFRLQLSPNVERKKNVWMRIEAC